MEKLGWAWGQGSVLSNVLYLVSVHWIISHSTPSSNEYRGGHKVHIASQWPNLAGASVYDAGFRGLPEIDSSYSTADVSIGPVRCNDWCTATCGKWRRAVATKTPSNSYVSIAIHLYCAGKECNSSYIHRILLVVVLVHLLWDFVQFCHRKWKVLSSGRQICCDHQHDPKCGQRTWAQRDREQL